jgi:hypothetical protein
VGRGMWGCGAVGNCEEGVGLLWTVFKDKEGTLFINILLIV